MFGDEPEDDGLGILESFELPDDELVDGFPLGPMLDEEWGG
jgi:hypothetical protein